MKPEMIPEMNQIKKPIIKPCTKQWLIALDIDGTILDKPTGVRVPQKVRDAIKDARAHGARVCLCSSRPCFFMGDATGDVGEVDALVGVSGAVIEIPRAPGDNRGEVFYKDRLPASLALAVFNKAQKHDLYVSFAGDEKILTCKKGPFSPPTGTGSVFAVMDDDELADALKNAPHSCAFMFTKPGMPDSLIVDEPTLSAATIQRASNNCFIITNKGTDKGTGVMRLAELWGIPRETVLAVGNDENDIAMLKAAGVGVAVANASPKTLAAADWIAPGVEDGGAAEAIRRFVPGSKP